MMEEKLLSSLNPARFMERSAWNYRKLWNGKIDVSLWMRANLSSGGRLYLYLEFQDQEGKRSVVIDRCMTPSAESILLNGRVSVSGRGAITALNVKVKCVGCDVNSIVVDELSVKPLESAVNSSIREAV